MLFFLYAVTQSLEFYIYYYAFTIHNFYYLCNNFYCSTADSDCCIIMLTVILIICRHVTSIFTCLRVDVLTLCNKEPFMC